MKVYTDSTNFADLIVQGVNWQASLDSFEPLVLRRLIGSVFADKPVFEAEVQREQGGQRWQYLFIAETSSVSQYDVLIEQRRQGRSIPDGLLCLSGAGTGLHGLRQRPWAAEAGNIHLSVFLSPQRSVIASGIPFMVLAAVSVVDAIDSVPNLAATAGIKWVNDIVLDNAKVGGVLAYTEGAGKGVDAAVLGIGLNVETRPIVEGTPFVPRVGALRDFSSDPASCTMGLVFEKLIAALDRNSQLLLDGRGLELVNRYRERSIVVGREVTVCVDDTTIPPKVIGNGEVQEIGDNLELVIAGMDAPICRGRLILDFQD